MKQHPLSAAFPAMPADELTALADDIRENGQREPGVIFEGRILDGWHRFQACQKAGIPFKSFPLPSGRDPLALVLSRNLHRRHLTGSQRAAAVVACSEWRERGKPNSAPGAELGTAEMAKAADVGTRTIEHAKEAHKAGLGNAVRDGELSAKKAAEQANPKPKPEPVRTVEDDLREQIATLKQALEDVTETAETAEAFRNGEEVKVMAALRAELRAVKNRRDELMRENVELKKQSKYWQRKAEKVAA